MGERRFALGLSGYAGSGKTTAALYLEKTYGFKRLHIAETLRAMLAVLMRANGIRDEMIDRYLTGDLKDGVIIPELGKTSRELQITLGTEWGRRYVGEGVWSNTWVRMSEDIPLVMNDSVRFDNEEDAIRGRGGVTVLVTRPGYGPAKFKHRFGKAFYRLTGNAIFAHDSERLDRLAPDYLVENDGDLASLHHQLDTLMAMFNFEKLPTAA
jgi:hypothetical protein